MLTLFLTRTGRALLTLALVVTASFFLIRASGDPALTLLGNDASAEALAAFRAHWGLDRSLGEQFLRYLGGIIQGDFGSSMREDRPALAVVIERIPVTLAITAPALLLQLALGLPAGVIAALHRNRLIDRAVMSASIIGFTVPTFILGLLLSLVFAVHLHWLPSTGSGSWRHALLPIVTLGVSGAATIARYARSAMVDVLGQPYIRTASAKGILWRLVVLRHALPNAAIPVVTVVGFLVGYMVAGAVLVENVFSWPGIGRLLVLSVTNRDFAVVQCILLVIGTTMVAANLCVDFLYGWIDPRIRRTAAGTSS